MASLQLHFFKEKNPFPPLIVYFINIIVVLVECCGIVDNPFFKRFSRENIRAFVTLYPRG